jgi:2-polyprenyl-3-methyl-5-hydroxy-6-metoxy-1,4-benzoquinol methylase
MEKYRERIYQYYVTAMEKDRAITRDSLRSRQPYLLQVIRHHFPRDQKARILDLGCGHGALRTRH